MTTTESRSRAAATYANQLLPFGHGYPLWFPEPKPNKPVRIGDVGWIENGSFFCLFNAMLPANSRANRRGVPDGFQPLHIDIAEFIEKRDGYMPAGDIHSKTVRRTTIAAGVGAGESLTSRFKFACTCSKGAVLVIHGGPAVQELLRPHADVLPYMRRHHMSWHAFATKLKHPVKPEDIFLVYGTVKANAWAVAAFTDESRDQSLELKVAGGALGNVGASIQFSMDNSMSVERRTSPKRIAKPGQPSIVNDQCLFVSRYKLRRREVKTRALWKKIEALLWNRSAKPRVDKEPSLPGGITETEHDEYDLENDSSNTQVSDPLESVLDYILENSDCKVAFASDDIIMSLHRAGYDSSAENIKKTLDSLREYAHMRLSPDDVGSLDLGDLPEITPPVVDESRYSARPDPVRRQLTSIQGDESLSPPPYSSRSLTWPKIGARGKTLQPDVLSKSFSSPAPITGNAYGRQADGIVIRKPLRFRQKEDGQPPSVADVLSYKASLDTNDLPNKAGFQNAMIKIVLPKHEPYIFPLPKRRKGGKSMWPQTRTQVLKGVAQVVQKYLRTIDNPSAQKRLGVELETEKLCISGLRYVEGKLWEVEIERRVPQFQDPMLAYTLQRFMKANFHLTVFLLIFMCSILTSIATVYFASRRPQASGSIQVS